MPKMEVIKLSLSRLIINPGKCLIVFSLFMFLLPVAGQDDYQQFYRRSLITANTGMYVLGTWALANIATGAYGWSKFDGERKYFNQMNLFWNSVNLAIAGFALYSNSTTDIGIMETGEIMKKHLDLEKVLLINAGLDVGYIGAGFILRHLSTRSEKKHDILKGYGNSVIMQGSFLLVFDAVMFSILRSERMDFLNNIDLAVAPGEIALLISF